MMMYVVIGIIIYLAIIFKINNGLKADDIFCAIFLINFAGLTVGNSLMYLPDISLTKKSLNRIFKLQK